MIDLASNRIGDEGIKSLGPNLTHLTSIQMVALGGNGISHKGIKSLGPHLAHLKSVQEMSCSCMHMCVHCNNAVVAGGL